MNEELYNNSVFGKDKIVMNELNNITTIDSETGYVNPVKLHLIEYIFNKYICNNQSEATIHNYVDQANVLENIVNTLNINI